MAEYIQRKLSGAQRRKMKRAAKRSESAFVYFEQAPSLMTARPSGLAHNGGWWKKRQRARATPLM